MKMQATDVRFNLALYEHGNPNPDHDAKDYGAVKRMHVRRGQTLVLDPHPDHDYVTLLVNGEKFAAWKEDVAECFTGDDDLNKLFGL